MKYGKTYSTLLSTPTWPQEWKDLALDYRGLKKLLNGVVEELATQGLNHEVLLDLLEAEREFEEHEALVGGGTHGSSESANQRPSQGSFSRSRAHYEFTPDATPRLRIWLHSEPDGSSSTPTDILRPSLLRLRSIPSTSHSRTSTVSSSCESSEVAEIIAPNPEEGGSGEIEEPALMSSSVDLVNQSNPLYALKKGYESSSRLELCSVEESDDGPSMHEVSSAATNSASVRAQPQLTTHNDSAEDIEVVVPLTADTAFHRVLAGALSSLSSLQTRTQSRVSDQIFNLADTISSCSGPPTRDRKSDLYAWREIFQLWVECQIYRGGATERERASGEGRIRDVAEAEKRLGMFASEIVKRGLGDRRTLKGARSRDALQMFLNLNFELANAEATRKILKKHEKRTALPSATSLTVLPISRSTGELPQMLITKLTETLLPVLPSLEDYSCLICTSIAFKPIRLACSHLFCVRCLVKMQKRGQGECPLCRTPCVLVADGSNLDVGLMNFMKEWFPKETKEKSDSNDRESAEEQLIDMGYSPGSCIIA
ncbi:unnamed protein product [Rhizoctonia solani]|uniref:RING-14 protein n=1 Tax=Rhizoctonia solani TaxID=456999 RepID=A0A8H3D7B9_9AGAM|nr:unnamed protein product [Rhizoctonia solani]